MGFFKSVWRGVKAVATGGLSEVVRHQKKRAQRREGEAAKRFEAERKNADQAVNRLRANAADASGLEPGGQGVDAQPFGLGGVDPEKIKLGKRKLLGE